MPTNVRRNKYVQSSLADARPPWTTPLGCFCWNWMQVGIHIMWRHGYAALNLHDEIVFVRMGNEPGKSVPRRREGRPRS